MIRIFGDHMLVKRDPMSFVLSKATTVQSTVRSDFIYTIFLIGLRGQKEILIVIDPR
jgi:hypothetical protein